MVVDALVVPNRIFFAPLELIFNVGFDTEFPFVKVTITISPATGILLASTTSLAAVDPGVVQVTCSISDDPPVELPSQTPLSSILYILNLL